VAFLRWIDNQQAYQQRLDQRIVESSDDRNPEEVALLGRVEEAGSSLASGFGELSVHDKWRVIQDPAFEPLYERFVRLAKEAKITLAEGLIEWSNPDVSANVGALILGFRKLVGDMLWLKVDQYWHMGLYQRMLPMMETVVLLDPHFIEAYALGAWHLAYNVTVVFPSAEDKQKYIGMGIHFLEKGLKSNPRSSKLYGEMGYTMYFRKRRDWEKAAYYLGEGTKYEHEGWIERAYALALERMGEEQKALAVREEFLRNYPDRERMQYYAVPRLKKKLEARELEEQGKLEEALEIWRFLGGDDTGDIVAPHEVLRLEQKLKTEQETAS
jgi:tetratricopeptide (TPR) repeat protein